LTIHLKRGIIKEKRSCVKMLMDIQRPFCPKCGARLRKTAQSVADEAVADETLDDLVVLCHGVCSCGCHGLYQWHERYSYQGYIEIDEVET
jgi:RNase P subunit RPR2